MYKKCCVFFPEGFASPEEPGPGPTSQEGPGPGPYGPILAPSGSILLTEYIKQHPKENLIFKYLFGPGPFFVECRFIYLKVFLFASPRKTI